MSKHSCALGATATLKKVARQSWSSPPGALQNFSATPGSAAVFLKWNSATKANCVQIQPNRPLDQLGWRLLSQTNAISVGRGTNWPAVTGSEEANQLSLPVAPATAFTCL